MLSFVLEDLKKKTEPYLPKDEERLYLESLRNDYTGAANEYFRAHRFLSNNSIDVYLQKCESAALSLSKPTRKDSWRNNTRTSIIPEKMDAIFSAVADLNLQPEVSSFSIYGDPMDDMAESMESLLEVANSQNLTDDKDRYLVREHLKNGTICIDVSFVQKLLRNRPISSENFSTGTVSFREGSEVMDGKISTSNIPLNRVILGSVVRPYIWDQPFIWKDYTLKYSDAFALFGKWPNWKYVKPRTSISREWGETAAQAENETDDINGLCRMLVFESVPRNEFAIVLNDVLMTVPRRPMPGAFTDKVYSVVWVPLIPFSPDFAFGESLAFRMNNDAVMYDFFRNSLVDRNRQELEPPVVTSFRSVVNRHMYRPGTATPVNGDFKVTPLILPNNGTNTAYQMLEFIDRSISNSSVSPIFQGQNQGGGQTALQIREQMRASLRVMWNVFSAVAESKRQQSTLMLRHIMEHYPSFGSTAIDGAISNTVGGIKRVFSTKGQVNGGSGDKSIAFANLSDRKAFDISSLLLDEQEKSATQGKAKKWYLIDPDTMRKSKHVVQVLVNPSQRKSKQADRAQVAEDYTLFRADPLIDQEWNTKNLLQSRGYKPDQAMQKNPQMQGQGQPPAPPMAPPKTPTEPGIPQMQAMDRAMEV